MPDRSTVPHKGAEPNGAGLIAYYNAIFSDRGFRLPAHLEPVAWALADERIRKLLLIIGPGSGKSLLLSVAYPTWRLGIDATRTIIGCSAGEALMQGFLHSAMEIIEWSPFYKSIFPKVRPDKVAGWSTERGIFVRGRNPGDPDASYWVGGITSTALVGKHARELLFDDLHNKDNSASVDQCEKVIEFYYNTWIGRADPRGARFVGAGRRWHEADIYGHLKESGEWVVMELPAQRTMFDGDDKPLPVHELWYDVTIPDGLTCVLNEGR